MNPNAYFIRLSGKANIPKELELGHGYKVLLDGEVVSATDHNNQDGTYDVIYSFKPALCEIQTDHGEVIKAKDMRSRSTQLRFLFKRYWEADPSSLDADDAYDRFMVYVMKNIPELYEASKK